MAAAVLGIAGLGLAGRAFPAAAAPVVQFDGTWATVFTCPSNTTDAAVGYTLQFGTIIKDGVVAGQNGGKGQPGSLTLEGRIEPDGSANLSASGLTGRPGRTTGQVAQGTPFSFHIKTRFEGSRATGNRVEGRACKLTMYRP